MLRRLPLLIGACSSASAFGVLAPSKPALLQRATRCAASAPLPFVRASGATRMMCEAPAEGPAAFELLDVRVGRIVEAWEHPDSEKLWCEKIDVGEEEPREIASGLREYYATADDLTGRKVLVVCNLGYVFVCCQIICRYSCSLQRLSRHTCCLHQENRSLA